VKRSVLPTSRGHAFESLAQRALSATMQWPTSVDPGGHWLGLDVASTGTALMSLETPRGRVVSVGTLAELAYAKNVVVYTVKFSNIKMDVISVAGPLWARGRLVLLAKS